MTSCADRTAAIGRGVVKALTQGPVTQSQAAKTSHAGAVASGMGAEADQAPDIVAAWREASLREFVANEDLSVRCSILPGLRLNPASYPPELRALVDAVVAIARSHPDEYIRHRVEIQVHL